MPDKVSGFQDLKKKVLKKFWESFKKESSLYGIMQWIWRGVNLKCIDAYAVLEWENDTKFHVFATKHKANT